ncbi:MAG: pYEATS domain-containing protein, partial [Bacteroidota bacterium]
LEYDCVLLSPPRHMAVGLVVDGYSGQHFTYEGKRYYYIETTGRNWDIGEIPTAYEGKTAVYEIWGVNGPRKALTYKGPSPASYEKGVLQVAFYRSHQGQSGDYEGKQAFQYRIQLEGDPTLLDRVKKVEYRRMHKSFAEYRDRTWLAKTHRGNNFRADWKGWGYTPITVKVTYKSGQTQLFLIENEPELAGI